MKKVRILGIESSCDETSVSVIERSTSGKVKILSNIVKSQLNVHKNFGGVVPELAARAHSEIIDELILMAVKKAKTKFEERIIDFSTFIKSSSQTDWIRNFFIK